MELAAIGGLWDVPWVLASDFSTTRQEEERKGCRRTRAIQRFIEFIQEITIVDPPLHGGFYTWPKDDNNSQASRTDRFLMSIEWDEVFRNIKQKVLTKAFLDHKPLMLECGDREPSST